MLYSPAALRRVVRRAPPLRLGLSTWLLLAFLLVMMPLISGATNAYRRSLTQRLAQTEDETERMATSAALAVDNLILSIDQTATALATAFGAATDLDQRTAGPYLAAVSRGASLSPAGAGAPLSFQLLDRDGRVIATPDGSGVGHDRSHEPSVRAVLDGEVRMLTDLLPATASTPPRVALIRAVPSPAGTRMGLVIATFTPAQLSILFAGAGADDAVEQVYDRAGHIVYNSRDATVPHEQRRAVLSPPVRAALAGQVSTLHGRDEALATAGAGPQVASFAPVIGIGWAVSVSRPVDTIRDPLWVMLERQIVSYALALLGALMLVIVLTRGIARPLVRLAMKARAAGRGERLELAAEGGPAEVRTLAAAVEGMAEEFACRLAEREAAVAARDQLVSITAHELKTPLTTLKATIQLAERQAARGAPGPRLVSNLSLADAQVNRLTRLVQELLDGARAATGQLTIDRRPVALGPLVRRVVELERAVDPDRRIELEEPDPSPVISLDAGRIEQALVNLLENARKYSPAETPIQVSVWVGEQAAGIAVRDQGPGIPAEQQAYIFDRFYRAPEAARAAPGLGLGLYIVDEIVRAHGGSLRVTSAPHRGSTFTILLPRDALAAEG
jgi:signal transduction histidine kinase